MFNLSPSSPSWSIGSLVAAAFFATGCVEDHELLRDDGHSGGAGSVVQDAGLADESPGAAGGHGGPDGEAGGAGGSPSVDASNGSSVCPDAAPLGGSPCANTSVSSSPRMYCQYSNRFCLCITTQGDSQWWCPDFPGFDGGAFASFDSGAGCPNQLPINMACFTDQSCSYGGFDCMCERTDAAFGTWLCL
jgi:hypothetical protein